MKYSQEKAMELKGSTINFLGDSITEGFSLENASERFTDLIFRQEGLKEARNYGLCGTRIARQQHPDPAGSSFDLDFCQRFRQMARPADAVVVFGGTNDYGHGDAPLGTFADRTPDTFYGACHFLMDGLKSDYPDKPIVFLTPLHRLNEEDPRGDWGKAVPQGCLRVYRDIILETALYHAIPVLDLYAVSGINPENREQREKLMPDGLHPNATGHRILARKIAAFLRLV